MENIRLAFQGIWSHKLRSFLTMLGIIIGISAIITIVSTIKGTNEQIKQNLIGSGSNVVEVNLCQDGYSYDFTYNPIPAEVRLIQSDMTQQLEQLDGVERVSLYRRRQWSDFVSVGNKTFSGETYGVDGNYFSVYDYALTQGRLFQQTDFERMRRVVILDEKAAGSLFGSEDPIGKVVEIKGEPFTVVGVAALESEFAPTITSYQDYLMYADTSSGKIFIPDTAWPVVFQFDEPQNVAVKATDTDAMTNAGKNVADVLNASQIVGYTAPGAQEEQGETEDAEVSTSGSSFSYKSQDLLEQAQQLQEMSNATNQQLIWIASISLLVGGIGVMNIMLVSVTERTSEIGLKKALGARKRRILIQFLTEASVLTSLGGLVGVALGIGLAQLISQTNGIPVAISVPAIAISVVFSTAIGLIFGLLPAMQAANLNPIDALRRE